MTALALATVAAHAGGPWAGGFGFLFLLIPLFWIGLIVLIFALVGRRWRRNAWAGGYGPWGHHMNSARARRDLPRRAVRPGRHRREGVPRSSRGAAGERSAGAAASLVAAENVGS